MQLFRLWTRLFLGTMWTLLVWLLRVMVWPLTWYSEALDRRLRHRIVRRWARGFAPLIGMKVEVTGPPPDPPYYIVANHLSYVDIWVLQYAVGCAFVARGDVQHWPVIGVIAKSVHVLFIDRERREDTVRINALIDHMLNMGDGLAVFAESRISRGLDVEPFKSALIEPAVRNEMPIHYATITYRTHPGCPPASKVVSWWRPEPFFHHLFRLLRCRGFTAHIHFGEEPLFNEDRKQLAQELHKAVRASYTPLE